MQATPSIEGASTAKLPRNWTKLYGDEPFSLERLDLGIQGGIYLIESLFELGEFRETIDGPSPQTWTEVANYGKLHDHLTSEELRVLHTLSRDWVSGFRLGKNPLSEPPIEALRRWQMQQ